MDTQRHFAARLALVTLALGLGMSNAARAADAAPPFEVYGFAMGDYIQDLKRVDPNWEDPLRPSKIPTTSGQFGSNGQALFSPKQSQLGVRSNLPVGGENLFTRFEL